MDGTNLLLPTLVYGCEPPEIRFRMHAGRQLVFCLRNGNLHLTEADLDRGTYETGSFLGSLCKEHCLPKRTGYEPCPAFARSHKVGTDNKGLAPVEMYPVPKWDLCLGVQKLLQIKMTPEERFFLLGYVEAHWTDEYKWRDQLVAQWNAHWHRVENGWMVGSRAAKFDQMVWWTLRYPALIPQVWLNWLHAAPEDLLKTLDRRPSRVDFVSFANGARHVVEIDGPSHYGTYNEITHTYSPDEREYARNLRIERWLRSERWEVTRIGRWEVSEVMGEDEPFGMWDLAAILPFGNDYPEQPEARLLGLEEIDRPIPVPANVLVDDFPPSPADDDIPF